MNLQDQHFLTQVAKIIGDQLYSANEGVSNGEAVNVVDGLFAVARAIHTLAKAIEDHE